MTISPKMRKICIWGGSAAGVLLMLGAMVKCSSNGSERDTAQKELAQETARADSLQNLVHAVSESRDAWYQFAQARGDTIQMLNNNTECADSIVVLNDSINVLNDSITGLNQKLTDCRNRRQGTRRNNGTRRQNDSRVKPGCRNSNVTVVSGADKQVTVPANTSGTVIVNNGDNNTVNVNNGTINNYYAPQDTSKVRITSSASVSTTYVVKVRRANCR